MLAAPPFSPADIIGKRRIGSPALDLEDEAIITGDKKTVCDFAVAGALRNECRSIDEVRHAEPARQATSVFLDGRALVLNKHTHDDVIR
jgi:hypothetical protein